MSDWPPRFKLTAEGAAKLIMLNFSQEQDETKTILAITRLVNEAYESGIAIGRAEPHVRAALNKAVITQNGASARIVFETQQEADVALDYINELGNLTADKTPLQQGSDIERLQRAITSAMDRLSNGDAEGGARILRECFWGMDSSLREAASKE